MDLPLQVEYKGKNNLSLPLDQQFLQSQHEDLFSDLPCPFRTGSWSFELQKTTAIWPTTIQPTTTFFEQPKWARLQSTW